MSNCGCWARAVSILDGNGSEQEADDQNDGHAQNCKTFHAVVFGNKPNRHQNNAAKDKYSEYAQKG
jgi:hypothetical protein